MDPIENQYWPFDVLPPEQRTEEHQQEIQFLESANRAGYKPYIFSSGSYGATAGSRAGEIIRRGSRHRQLFCVDAGELIVSAHVNGFDCAAGAL
jgi:hypothetical protein